ncbi:MAG TPA: IS21 family transposase [Firmicutes bacterium]|nr:IS21 family transposase [Bacillota bacterium]
MLTMIQIQHIKYQSFNKGQSMRSIARDTGHNFRTVKKYIEQTDFNEPARKKQGRPSKLDAVKPIIDAWLTEDLNRKPKQRHTAKRIYDRLVAEHDDIFNASERTVRAYVAAKKKELYASDEGYLPLDHPPGEAQVDFGEVVFYEKGQKVTGYELVISFPYSNGGYPQLLRGQNQECLFTGMIDIFEHMKKVPEVIWFDNLSAAVAGINGQGRSLTERFQRFSLHYGFEARFCNPDSGHEKGNVENKVGYSRRNFFVPEPEFDDIEEYNRRLFAVAEKDHERFHYKKNLLIARLLEEDKAHMLPLPGNPFEVAKWQKAKANKVGKVKFDTNTYSSSPAAAGKEVWIKADAHMIEILNEDYQSIVKHRRLYGKNLEAMNWYPYLTTLAKRPNALKYTGFYRELPDPWQDYLAICDHDGKKGSLKVLLKILEEKDMDTATSSLEECLANGTATADNILLSYYRLTQETIEESLKLPSNLVKMSEYSPDLSSYDLLLREVI